MTQPFGFASPVAPPLSVADEPPRPPASEIPPNDYSAPPGPQPALAEITPAPLEQRDPTSPFTDSAPELEPQPAWQPHQPLTSSAPSQALAQAASQVDPATLPPPTGAPVSPVPYHQANPFGVNPYATGPYSAPAPHGYPPPVGGPASGPPPGHQQYPRQITFQSLLAASNPYVLGPLLIGGLWPEVAAFALMAAAVIGLVRSSPGRVLVAAAGALCLVITLVWFMGYIGNGQWQSTSQLLSLVALIGVPLITYQQMRR